MATDLYNNRRTVIIAFFALACLVLVVKAFFLQVVDSTYRERATGIDKYTVYPSRGLVYDRNDKLLVYNDPIYDLMVTVSQMDSKMDTLKFCRLLGIEKADFKERLNKDFRSGRFSRAVPFVFLSKISPEICARFRENLFEYPGFFLQLRNVRGYPYASSSHILGYIREVNDQEVKNSGGLYIAGDYIGASGLEASYENALRGRKGAKYILKDNLGREVGSYKEGEQDTLPISGKDLIATIDIELQRYGESLMVNKLGSIVAIEPATGEILSMVSSPYYDPNLLTIGRERGKAFQMLQQDTLQPLLIEQYKPNIRPDRFLNPLWPLSDCKPGCYIPTGPSAAAADIYSTVSDLPVATATRPLHLFKWASSTPAMPISCKHSGISSINMVITTPPRAWIPLHTIFPILVWVIRWASIIPTRKEAMSQAQLIMTNYTVGNAGNQSISGRSVSGREKCCSPISRWPIWRLFWPTGAGITRRIW